MRKRSWLSLIALILGAIGLVMLFGAFRDLNVNEDAAGAIVGFLVLPSIVGVVIGFILNVIGFFMTHKTLTLISAIFYGLGFILMPLWGFVAAASMILQFVAFAKMKKAQS